MSANSFIKTLKLLFWLAAFIVVKAPTFGQNLTLKNAFNIDTRFHDPNLAILNGVASRFDTSLSQSVRLGYTRYLSRFWNLSTGLGIGFYDFQLENEGTQLINKSFFLGLDYQFRLKLNNDLIFKQNAFIKPYFGFGNQLRFLPRYSDFGVNATRFTNQYALGIDFGLGSKSNINVQTLIDQEMGNDFKTGIIYQLGYSSTIGKENQSKSLEPVEKDTDQDGIADLYDKCPSIAGIAKYGGCPQNYVDEETYSKEEMDSVKLFLTELDEKLADLKIDYQALELAYLECENNLDSTKKINRTLTKNQEDLLANNSSEKNTNLNTNPKNNNNSEREVASNNNTNSNKESKDNFENPKYTTKEYTKENKISSFTEDQLNNNDLLTEYSYYVVTIVTMHHDKAIQWSNNLKLTYPSVEIQPIEGGLYRVGIYATKSKTEALKMWNYVKNDGHPKAWLAKY